MIEQRTINGEKIGFPDGSKLWRHIKTDGIYAVLCPAVIEAGTVPAVLYSKSGGDGTVWVRPVTEFLDGRFEVMP